MECKHPLVAILQPKPQKASSLRKFKSSFKKYDHYCNDYLKIRLLETNNKGKTKRIKKKN